MLLRSPTKSWCCCTNAGKKNPSMPAHKPPTAPASPQTLQTKKPCPARFLDPPAKQRVRAKRPQQAPRVPHHRPGPQQAQQHRRMATASGDGSKEKRQNPAQAPPLQARRAAHRPGRKKHQQRRARSQAVRSAKDNHRGARVGHSQGQRRNRARNDARAEKQDAAGSPKALPAPCGFSASLAMGRSLYQPQRRDFVTSGPWPAWACCKPLQPKTVHRFFITNT